MKNITLTHNEDTLNTEIKIIGEGLSLTNATLKPLYLKSTDVEDYYEFDISENEYEIINLKFKSNGDNCYDVFFIIKIIISDEKWANADETFKSNAKYQYIELGFNIESDGKIYEREKHFKKINHPSMQPFPLVELKDS